MLKDDNYDKNLIDDHFCEDAYGRNGHGLVSKSKKNKSISLRFQNWHKMMPLETETIIHLAAINLNPQDSAFDEEYFRVKK